MAVAYVNIGSVGSQSLGPTQSPTFCDGAPIAHLRPYTNVFAYGSDIDEMGLLPGTCVAVSSSEKGLLLRFWMKRGAYPRTTSRLSASRGISGAVSGIVIGFWAWRGRLFPYRAEEVSPHSHGRPNTSCQLEKSSIFRMSTPSMRNSIGRAVRLGNHPAIRAYIYRI